MDTRAGFTFPPIPESAAAEEFWRRITPAGDIAGQAHTEDIMASRIVTICETTKADGRRVIKVCLQHPVTAKVLFLSASNRLTATEKDVPAREEGWYVYRANALAPGRFWNNVKARLAA
jgi:hypothetical protein